MTNKDFKGTGVALATPFGTSGEIDYPALERLVNHCIDGGVDYLVVMGTTAESPTLSLKEKSDVLDKVLATNNGRLPVVYGAGGNDTAELTEYLSESLFREVDAILSVTPYYNKPSQKGLEVHFKNIADRSPVPVILYNVPARTSVNMDASTTLKLAEHKNIIAIKEASGNFNQFDQILLNKPPDFLVISGNDMDTLPMMAIGAEGVISVMANAYPGHFSNMVSAALNGDYQKARVLHLSLAEMGAILSEEGNPAGLKYVLKLLKVTEEHLRLPLFPISDGLKARAEQAVAQLKA